MKNKQQKIGQLAPTPQYCTYCNRPGHPDSICQARLADEENHPATMYSSGGNYSASYQPVGNYNPMPGYNQQYHSQGNYSSPPAYQDQGQRQGFQGQQ